ncbi:L-histidine N(alpha)-methyltransferase [Beijerinckia indica]|uniref:Histidine-specific methyltransferase SAM-dependent domain-containing protein n=1 Tax=Beijerinckia indica subsp. indica (strain ATCC 9039 / DSM 1715 / NCIMB 8712) TaxID=395963 RepID=B2ID59_BEII9|nr:L-histidine N(alpha)-methyltransferase [Beijerinckia indica]ACB96824.1 conserved hypothetical protein [Beijerinckia indica subsp. indica ATCC 9039]
MFRSLRKLQDLEPSVADFRDEVIEGLTSVPKTLPCKFFYDTEGSILFDRICEVPAYYLTRTECAILARHAPDIAEFAGPGARLVEFGSGAGIKVRRLLNALSDPSAYVPIDISRTHLLRAAEALAEDFPNLPIMPVCADYTRSFTIPWQQNKKAGRLVGFFPGSTIGNFMPSEMQDFFRRSARLLGPGSLMIVGVDLPKDKNILEAAYDDREGATAAFNLNLLRRANRELYMNFNVSAFKHEAQWNAAASRVEMYLVSLVRQSVKLNGYRFDFLPGEKIHTENSYKYTISDFIRLVKAAGYEKIAAWTDEDDLFSVHVLRVTDSDRPMK